MAHPLSMAIKGYGTEFRVADMGIVEFTWSPYPDRTKSVEDVIKILTDRLRAYGWAGQKTDPSAAIASFDVVAPKDIYRRLIKNTNTGANFRVIFRDVGVLGKLATSIVDLLGLRLESIQWWLTDDTRRAVMREARQKALKDAIQQANDAASIVGSSVTPINIANSTEPGDHYSDIVYMDHPIDLQTPSTYPGRFNWSTCKDMESALKPHMFRASAAVIVTFVSTSAPNGVVPRAPASMASDSTCTGEAVYTPYSASESGFDDVVD